MAEFNDIETPEVNEVETKRDFTPIYSYTQKVNSLISAGKITSPKYRTLSQEQMASYLKAKDMPEYDRKVAMSALKKAEENTFLENASNAATIEAMDILSGDKTRLAIGNMLVTGDYSPLVEAGATLVGYKAGEEAAKAAGRGWIAQTGAGIAGATAAGAIVGAITPTATASEEEEAAIYMTPEQKAERIKQGKEFYEQTAVAQLKKAGYTDEQIEKMRKEPAVQSFGRAIMQSAMNNIEYKAAIAPKVDEGSVAATIVGGAASFGELALVGAGTKMAASKIARSVKMPTDRFGRKAAEFTAKKGTPYEEVVDRYAGMVGTKAGTAAATTEMSSEIMGQGALESVRKYIEDTGDTKLEYYQGDLKNVALDAYNTHIQNIIEYKLGIGKFIKNPRLATKYGEWLNGFAQEFSQGEINDIAEWLKGNQTAMDILKNIPQNMVEGVVGAVLQGGVGTGIYTYYHNQNVNDLTDVVMSQSTAENPIDEQKARSFAEKKVTELEEGIANDVAQDIVQFTGATQYQGKIYDTIRDNVKKAIDYQREQMKETLEGSKYDDMTEDELAQHIESVAQDTTDRAVIEALDAKIPLSESPLLKGETIDGTYYIEGSDYAKQTAEKAQQERAKIRKAVYAAQNAAEDAKKEVQSLKEEIKAKKPRVYGKAPQTIKQLFTRRINLQFARDSGILQAFGFDESSPVSRIHFKTQGGISDWNDIVQVLEQEGIMQGYSGSYEGQVGLDEYAKKLLLETPLTKLYQLRTDFKSDEKIAKKDAELLEKEQEAEMDSLLKENGLTDDDLKDMSWEDKSKKLNELYPETTQLNTLEDLTEEEWAELESLDFQDLAEENARLDEKYPAYEGETIVVDGKERTVYNSNGDRIAKSKEALTNFWRWFGDSKVVDEQGRPLVVYHGTKAQFDEFLGEKIGQSGTSEGVGFYFTNDENVAKGFGDVMSVYLKLEKPIYAYSQVFIAEDYDGDLDIMEANAEMIRDASMQVLEDLKAKGYEFYNETTAQMADIYTETDYDSLVNTIEMYIKDGIKAEEYDENKLYNDIREAIIKEFGFDGFKTKGYGSSNATVYVALMSNQIKSVDNRGTYSSDTGNIYYQSAYAGSRADYDKPSLEAIGSGEGNQAHGWGLYYALNPEIAENYRKKLADDYNQKILYKGKEISYDYHNSDNIKENVLYEIELHMDEYDNNIQKTIDAFITKNKQELSGWETRIEADKKLGIESFAKVMAGRLNLLKEKITILQSLSEKDFTRKQKGQVHEVDIPEMDVLLDEQKTFSEQSDFVREQLAKIGSKYLFDMSGLSESEKIAEASKIMKDWDGAGIYDRLSTEVKGDKRASQVLEKYGIKGITYEGRIDGRCFVIFNPKDVKVLRKKFDELGNVLFQNRQRGKGGAYDARNRSITLGSGANVTTLPHELAHYWIDKNFKWARSGKASTAWMQQWQAVEKWLGIDPEDKYLTSEASEKFARAYERFLGEEELPLVLKKSMADFRDFVLDHYDYELDDAKGLQDRLGRPIKLNEDVKNWFRKSVYDSYMSPADMEVVNERLAQTDREIKEVQPAIDQSKELENAAQNSVEINEVAPTGMDIQKSADVSNDVILGKKTIGGGEEKESKGAIASALGKTYESTSWDIQDQMISDYLETVSIDEALDALEDGTYPDKIDPNFLRQALVERLLDEGREIEAAALIEETADDFTEAAQKLQAARRVNTPFTNAIRMLTIGKATKLAEARYGKNKDAVKSLDAAMNALVAKYEKDFMNAKTDEERELVYAAMQDEAVRTIGTLEKDKTGGLDFQDIEDKEEKKQAKELRKRQIRRASINAYRSRAKRALKQALGLEPSREQVRQIKKLSVKVAREIKDFRKALKENKTSAIDPTKILEAQNELNEYMNKQLPPRVLSTAMDAVNSYMMANMLWNPATNVFNIESTWMQMIPHILATYINYGKGTISWGEKRKLIKQALALQAKTGYNIFSLQDFFDKKTIWAEKFYESTSTAGKAIRFPLTMLGLADTMNKGIVFLNHVDSMATKQAKEEGKKNGWNKEQITKRAKELFYQALNTDPRTITRDGLKIRQSAVREGEEATFTQNSQTAQFVNKFRKMLNLGAKTGLGNVIMPFTTTVANIAEDTVLNYGLGSVRNLPKIIPALATQFDKTATAEMKKEAWNNVKPETKNVIKNMIGIAMILSLALSDPDDDSYVLGYDRQTEVDKDIRQNRNAPSGYAVHIGNKWIDLDLFGIGSPWARAYLIAKRHNNTTDGWVKGVASMIDLVPGVSEIEDIYKSFETTVKYKGESEAVSEFVGGKAEDIIERLIPAQALFNEIGNITDVTKRVGYGSVEARVKGKLPFARETLEERTSKQTGEPIKQMDTLANLLTGQRVKEYVESTPADRARYELAKEGKPLNYQEGRSKLKELGKESKEYKKAVQRVRRDFTRKLNSAVQTSEYQNLDADQKKKFADKLHKEALEDVKEFYGLKDKKSLKKQK